MSHTVVPHLAFPFHVDFTGRAETLEQDTPDEIIQCVQVILMTREGERLEVPSFGIADLAFTSTIDTGALVDEISAWEPRASVVIDESPDLVDELLQSIHVLTKPVV